MNVSIVHGEKGIKALKATSDAAVVIIDVFRASTTITVVLEKEARCVVPVNTNNDALQLKNEHHIIIGEEHGLPPAAFDHGNSPWEISQRVATLAGKIVVMKTTNGTRGILAAINKGFPTYVGCFRNARPLAEHLMNRYEQVILVPMGTNERPRIEDDNCAELLRCYLVGEPVIESALIEEVKKERLNQNWHIPTWKEDVYMSLELNTSSIIPFCKNDCDSGYNACIIDVGNDK